MTKTGTGTVTFAGPQAFGPASGTALAINAGVVNVNSTFAKSISVASAGTLSGTGTVSGAVTSSGKIAPGGIGVASAALTLSNAVTLNAGASLDFDFSSTNSDTISGITTLTLSGGAGTIAVNLNDLGGLGDGDFTLISHANALADISALAIGTHPAGTYALVNNSGAITLHVTGFGQGLTWNGNVNGTWDVNTTANFAGGTGMFAGGDRVTFDDTASGTTTITIADGGVSPAKTTFNNAGAAHGGKDYIVGGPGGINGSGDLVKDGSGSLTLTGANNFTGAVLVDAGTLSISSGAAVGMASGITLGGVTFIVTGNTTVAPPITVSATSTIDIGANNVTFGGALSGSGAINKSGGGTLTLSAASAGFAGGMNINAGTVRVTANDGIGSGPVNVNGGTTLRLENVSFGAPPNLTLNDGSTLQATGVTTYSKSNYPAIANGTSGAAPAVTIAAMSSGDDLVFGSAIRNVANGSSFATINVNPNGEAGAVVLGSGGLSATNTFSGSWTLNGGFLQIGPNSTSTSEAMNALGFKNGDAKQANAIIITGGTLLGAINAPQAVNAGTTPTYFRAGVTLGGGSIASTGLSANFGGDFATAAGTTSQVLVYDPLAAGTAREVNLVAGATTSLSNAASTSWAGTLVVTPGALATGGAFNISRTGGTISVTPGAMMQINQGATVNLGGAADALSDGVDFVNVVNNSTAGGFNATARYEEHRQSGWQRVAVRLHRARR